MDRLTAAAGRLNLRDMEIVLATAYVGSVVVATSWLLWWLAPGVPGWLVKVVPAFTPACIVLFFGAVLTVSIFLRKPDPEEIDASGLALIAIIFTTVITVLFLTIAAGIGRSIMSGLSRKSEDQSPNR